MAILLNNIFDDRIDLILFLFSLLWATYSCCCFLLEHQVLFFIFDNSRVRETRLNIFVVKLSVTIATISFLLSRMVDTTDLRTEHFIMSLSCKDNMSSILGTTIPHELVWFSLDPSVHLLRVRWNSFRLAKMIRNSFSQ